MTNVIKFPFERTAVGRIEARGIRAATQEERVAWVPAYYPDNVVTGHKYEATRRMDIKDIAKEIRKEIAAKKKSGEFPKDLKVSVTISRFSMGQSMNARIKGGLKGINPEFVKDYNEYLNDGDDTWEARRRAGNEHTFLCPEDEAIIEAIDDMGKAYNRENCDSMSDYSDVNFYWTAEASWDYRDAMEKEAEIKY